MGLSKTNFILLIVLLYFWYFLFGSSYWPFAFLYYLHCWLVSFPWISHHGTIFNTTNQPPKKMTTTKKCHYLSVSSITLFAIVAIKHPLCFYTFPFPLAPLLSPINTSGLSITCLLYPLSLPTPRQVWEPGRFRPCLSQKVPHEWRRFWSLSKPTNSIIATNPPPPRNRRH